MSRFTSVQEHQLRAEYEAGATTTELALRWQANRKTVAVAIVKAGGKMRTQSESLLRFARKQADEANLPIGIRRCFRCKEVKPLKDFARQRARINGVRRWCRDCFRVYSRSWVNDYIDRVGIDAYRTETRRRDRIATRLRKFGITEEEYQAKLATQQGRCALCGDTEKSKVGDTLRELAVDHDHSSGAIRGLLCSKCNCGLGQFKDNIELLLKAVAYLQSYVAKLT